MQACSYLIWGHEGPGVFTHHLGIRWQQTVAVVQSSRRHLLEHRLAGRHGVATVMTDGRGGGDLTGALAVTHWDREAGRLVSLVLVAVCFNTYIEQSDNSMLASFCAKQQSSRQPTRLTCSLTQTGEDRANKHTHWPLHCGYLRSSAKAIPCAHALTTGELPSYSVLSTQTSDIQNCISIMLH